MIILLFFFLLFIIIDLKFMIYFFVNCFVFLNLFEIVFNILDKLYVFNGVVIFFVICYFFGCC